VSHSLLRNVLILFIALYSTQWVMGQEQISLLMEDHRPIFVEVQKPAQPDFPSFLLLPGVNRSWRSPDPFLTALKEAGYGYVSMSFSIQPFSVSTLGVNELAYFQKKGTFGLKDLVDEVVFVEQYFSKLFSSRLLPVTLSYSGLLGPDLPFPVVLNLAPLTSTGAGYPTFENQRQSLLRAEIFNPIFGPMLTRQTLDSAYRIHWTGKIDQLIQEFNLSWTKRSQMVEGQTQLSRLAEGLEWHQPTETTHIFFIGGEESASLLKHQLETIAQLIQEKQQLLTYFIPNSGHVIPADQPLILLAALKQLTAINEQKTSKEKSVEVCLIVTMEQDPKTWRGLNCEQALLWVKDLASKL
jgi:hypothetical protein